MKKKNERKENQIKLLHGQRRQGTRSKQMRNSSQDRNRARKRLVPSRPEFCRSTGDRRRCDAATFVFEYSSCRRIL